MQPTATAAEAGTYEVAFDWDVLIELGDRAIVQEGARRILFRTRRPWNWALPLYDWRPEDVARGWLLRVSESIDEEALDTYNAERAARYSDALGEHHLDLHAADLRSRDLRNVVRERAVKIVRDVPLLRMGNLVSFFVGTPDGYHETGTRKWWDRTNRIGHYVHDRLQEAQDQGVIEPVGRLEALPDDPPRSTLWRATGAVT